MTLLQGNTRWRRTPASPEQVIARLAEDLVIEANGCWSWSGGLDDGYGFVSLNGRVVKTHRAMFEAMRGPIGAQLTLDHLCHTADLDCIGSGEVCVHRRCLNPDHLEPVSNTENCLRGGSPHAVNARKTHCPQGHPLSGDNLLAGQGGRRRCKTCARERWHIRKLNRIAQEA